MIANRKRGIGGVHQGRGLNLNMRFGQEAKKRCFDKGWCMAFSDWPEVSRRARGSVCGELRVKIHFGCCFLQEKLLMRELSVSR